MTRTTVGTSWITAALLALATAAAAQTAVPPGDSYLCYKAPLASGEEKFTPVQKTLEDQSGTLVVDVKGIAVLCNPTQTAAHPAVHAVGYKFAAAKSPEQAKFVKSDHMAIDQFGTHPLTLVKPIEVRAPSAAVPGAAGTGLVDTTGVDHFECYKAKPAKGAPKFVAPAPLEITDEFGTQSYTLAKITRFCTPVNKNGEDATAPQHVGHLVCYQAKLPAEAKFTPQPVSVNNANFGPAVLLAKTVMEVCVPAFKDTTPTTTTCSAEQPCSGGIECCSGTCLPPDAFCRRLCSVTTSQTCSANADCPPFPTQTCGPLQIVPNRCGFGTCLREESCCNGLSCCRNYDQLCNSSSGQCLDVCPSNMDPCADTCCALGEVCGAASGTCKTSCGSALCEPDTETCCSDRCCNTATQFCQQQSGIAACVARRTCTGTDVYIPSTDQCCSQQAACGGNNACCNNVFTTYCDTATGQCMLYP